MKTSNRWDGYTTLTDRELYIFLAGVAMGIFVMMFVAIEVIR